MTKRPGPAHARARERVDGVLLLDKPVGVSSTRALGRARFLLGARKAGHGGTLDPLASGLLPLLFGEATKFAGDSLAADKVYLAEVTLGRSTDTGDGEGREIAQREPVRDEAVLRAALASFVGLIEQVPPMHSALKHEGRPLYELARAGVTVERRARQVMIHAIDLLQFAPPLARLRVHCSKGTYVRTLAIDLGERLGCGAFLSALRRERVGALDVADAFDPVRLEAMDPVARRACLLPIDALMQELPRIDLDALAAQRFAHGQRLPLADLPVRTGSAAGRAASHVCTPAAGRVRVYGAGRLLGLARQADGELQPLRLVSA